MLIALLLGLWGTALHAAEWQVVLLKPRGCGLCVYLEEMLKRGSQMQQAVLDDGKGGQVTASIQRRLSADLSVQEWNELRALPWFDERTWRQQATARAAQVLLKRDGVVVSAGNIGDSADLRSARYPATITTPDAGSDPSAARGARSQHLLDLYLQSWNLNWFYRLALDPSLMAARNGSAWINASVPPAALPANSVMLMSTATGAADNEIFNALRIEEISAMLAQSLALDPGRLGIYYGGGRAQGANALEVRGGQMALVRRDVAGAESFTPEAALRIFQSIRARPASRNLLVLIGHGDPDGAGMWGSPAPLSPATLRALHEYSGGDNVLVSGNCFGGVMARATSCGFFGARPDVIATGCQADAAEVAQSRDYLHMFFASLAPTARTAADADGNGAISFAEAHWYASAHGDPRNVTYTSVDALADAWFDAHPDALPSSLRVGEVQALAVGAPMAEARALREVLTGFHAGVEIRLDDLAGQANQWQPGSGMPRAMAGQLTRRLLFQQKAQDRRAELARLQSCENRAIADFLAP